jgi:hypothetical protein
MGLALLIEEGMICEGGRNSGHLVLGLGPQAGAALRARPDGSSLGIVVIVKRLDPTTALGNSARDSQQGQPLAACQTWYFYLTAQNNQLLSQKRAYSAFSSERRSWRSAKVAVKMLEGAGSVIWRNKRFAEVARRGNSFLAIYVSLLSMNIYTPKWGPSHGSLQA